MRCLPWKHDWVFVPGSHFIAPVGSDHMSGCFPCGRWVKDECIKCGRTRSRKVQPAVYTHWKFFDRPPYSVEKLEGKSVRDVRQMLDEGEI